MAYPCLIPDWALNADVHICLSADGVTEDGEDAINFEADLKCNIQLNTAQRLTPKKEIINITGKACFKGDIWPEATEIKGGTLTHNSVEYDIHKVQRSYNFDGTVNYTEVELM